MEGEPTVHLFDWLPGHASLLSWFSARDLAVVAETCKTFQEIVRGPDGVVASRVREICSRYACLSRELQGGAPPLEGLAVLEAAAQFMDTASGHYAFSETAGLFIAPNGVFRNYSCNTRQRVSHCLLGALTIRGACQLVDASGDTSKKRWNWKFDRWYVHCEVNGQVLTTKEELHEFMMAGGWLDDDLRCFCLDSLQPAPVCQPATGEPLRVAANGLPYTKSEFEMMNAYWDGAQRYTPNNAPTEEQIMELLIHGTMSQGPAWVLAKRLPCGFPAELDGSIGRILYWSSDGSPCLVAFAVPLQDHWIPASNLRVVDGPPVFMESDKRLTMSDGWDLSANPPRPLVPRQAAWDQIPPVERARLLASSRGVGPSETFCPEGNLTALGSRVV